MPSAFRIDRFVKASADSLLPLGTDRGARVFGAQGKHGMNAIEVPTGRVDWFRFYSVEPRKSYYCLLLDVRCIGKRISHRDLAFPAIAKLRQTITITDFATSQKDGLKTVMEFELAVMAKMTLAASGPVRKKIDEALHHPDWNQLRKRDRRLGQAYRAALAMQGISFSAPSPSPATQPAY